MSDHSLLSKVSVADAERLLLPQTIRSQAERMLSLCESGGTQFRYHSENLSVVADQVLAVMKKNYPDLKVPYHSRWRHFEVGNRRQLERFDQIVRSQSPLEQLQTSLDMVIPSVLLDAGAGATWRYLSEGNAAIGRSEGLALASLDSFLSGAFGQTSAEVPIASIDGLRSVTETDFCRLFQVREDNPLTGVPGRVGLLHALAETMASQPEAFPLGRLSDFGVGIIRQSAGKPIAAQSILLALLRQFGHIWPSRLNVENINLGDTWVYSGLGDGVDSLVPFHKLSQWLCYSICETFERCGFPVVGIEQLTGLAEYRNGGLLLDSGLLQLRKPELAAQPWRPEEPIIVEWRALTVALLDRIGQRIRENLGVDEASFPLARVLEGGTWAAGREIAKQLRADMSPPLTIVSDGTVF